MEERKKGREKERGRRGKIGVRGKKWKGKGREEEEERRGGRVSVRKKNRKERLGRGRLNSCPFI